MKAAGTEMKTWKIAGLALSLATASTAAFAFQQQQGGAPGSAAVEIAPQGDVKAMDLNTTASGSRASTGTEVSIPGLGKLGVLPKMDFGLELLYGASDSKQPIDPRRDLGSDDMTIHGTLKHRF
jgi:hypothetical protein